MQTRKEKFEQFHQQHPEVAKEIIQRAREVKAVGFATFGARRIWEGMRWYFSLKQGPNSQFKLNDHLVPYYARFVMDTQPDLAGLFELRKLHNEGEQS